MRKSVEEKAQGLDVLKEKPTLVSMIGIQKMAFLGVKKCREGMVDAMKVDGLPQNPDFIEIITRCKSKYAQDDKGKDIKQCRFERSLFWEITESLAVAGNDLRVGNQLFFKPKIIVKQTLFNRVHTKDPRPTSSIQC